jgi:hypothetical protein
MAVEMAQHQVLGPALLADLMRISNPELTKAIQLVEQAFQISATDPTRAFTLFEKSSISFLQAIRSTLPLPLHPKRHLMNWGTSRGFLFSFI